MFNEPYIQPVDWKKEAEAMRVVGLFVNEMNGYSVFGIVKKTSPEKKRKNAIRIKEAWCVEKLRKGKYR
jgi:hypothetical protein